MTGAAHLRFVDYGRQTRRDETGIEMGTFHPLDAVLGVGGSKPFSPKLSIGFNVNFIMSQLESYNSLGASVDMGGLYHNEEKEFSAALVVKNAGYQFKTYAGNRSSLPVEVQLGLTKKISPCTFQVLIIRSSLEHLGR